ncbi:S41 family peptidase [Thalassotalea hakodatensis]|uniref:S41 family peptidase n=1 Tax=Thalassotalea hakodatensis TaxID=3030492 RepID=UPI0025733B56|nr:S41 family peptidase [Thalassotalea hakodatensis]
MPDLKDPTIVNKQLTVNQMHQDIDYLIEGALARHPDFSAYANLEELSRAIHKVKQEITKPMIRAEFYRYIGKLNHLFNDGHSFLIWPYNEWKIIKEQGKLIFPFDIVISESAEIIIKNTYSDVNNKLIAGTTINKINGVPSKELISALQQYVGGETQRLREQIAAERFSLVLWAVYGFISQFELEVSLDNKTSTLLVSTGQKWEQNIVAGTKKPYYYKVIKPGVGYLYLEHFDIDPDTFEEFIDKTFTEIKQEKISSLIIDIRNNSGGNTDTVTYLTRYIADKPFRLISSVREKLNQDNRGWFDYKGEVGKIITKEWTDMEKPIANGYQFTGNTYLLIGAVSYSSAIVFATTLKDNQFATLVGEVTGGFANQTAQGNLFNLPNSQLRAYIATRSLVRPSGDLTRQGVVPHHIAYNSPDDIKAQQDAGIERILSLIGIK